MGCSVGFSVGFSVGTLSVSNSVGVLASTSVIDSIINFPSTGSSVPITLTIKLLIFAFEVAPNKFRTSYELRESISYFTLYKSPVLSNKTCPPYIHPGSNL